MYIIYLYNTHVLLIIISKVLMYNRNLFLLPFIYISHMKSYSSTINLYLSYEIILIAFFNLNNSFNRSLL